ncbi:MULTISPECIES: hypothetical protein [unclassified Streptomyces]|uniref:hypothetical protein n=1 Tax=unclassified Streptomyces TaxID=2593676 RepID=UPI003D9355F8
MSAPSAAQSAWSVRLWQYSDDPCRGWTNHLFSDAEITGTVDGEPIGPYRITSFDTTSNHQPGQLRPVLELGSWFRDPKEEPPASGSSGWTGLSIHQEVTALLSLILGIRLSGDDPVIHRRGDDGSITTYHPSARIAPSAPSSPWASPIIPGLALKLTDVIDRWVSRP